MNKSVMAARAAKNIPTRVTMPAHLRYVAPRTGYVGAVRNRRAVRMTGAQRDSQGRISAWARSPYAPKGGWR